MVIVLASQELVGILLFPKAEGPSHRTIRVLFFTINRYVVWSG